MHSYALLRQLFVFADGLKEHSPYAVQINQEIFMGMRLNEIKHSLICAANVGRNTHERSVQMIKIFINIHENIKQCIYSFVLMLYT